MIPGEWWALAACQAIDPDLFFPISGRGRAEVDVARARQICHHCQVRSKCLDFALATGPVHGIWGGLTETERQALLAPGTHRTPDERPAA